MTRTRPNISRGYHQCAVEEEEVGGGGGGLLFCRALYTNWEHRFSFERRVTCQRENDNGLPSSSLLYPLLLPPSPRPHHTYYTQALYTLMEAYSPRRAALVLLLADFPCWYALARRLGVAAPGLHMALLACWALLLHYVSSVVRTRLEGAKKAGG